jgi:Vitamin K-dependent gamma-carboxylase
MISAISLAIRNKVSEGIRAWNNFWFSPLDLYNVSLFRFLLGISLLALYLFRATEFNLFFANDGVLPIKYALEAMPEGYRSILPFFLKTDQGIRIQGVVHLVLLFLFAIGAFGRSLTWLLFVVNLGLMQRDITIVYGADLFGNFWLFYLSFVNHNQHFSIWNWIKKSRTKILESDLFSTVGIRLIQIQLCISYAYTGVEKLKGHQWWEGTAVWYVIGMDDLVPHDLAFMQNFPLLVGILSMTTIIFEIYFIFAVWNKKLVRKWLFVGLCFHFCTAIFMDLQFFFLVITAPYLLFLPSLRDRLKFLPQRLRRA